jgi:hypothetical protein
MVSAKVGSLQLDDVGKLLLLGARRDSLLIEELKLDLLIVYEFLEPVDFVDSISREDDVFFALDVRGLEKTLIAVQLVEG